MTATAPGWADRLATACFAIACIAAIAAAFLPDLPLLLPAGALLAYLLLAGRRIRRLQALAGGTFLLAGLSLAAWGVGIENLPARALDASGHTIPLLLLFGAVAWLHHGVRSNADFLALGARIAEMPPGRRILSIGLFSHFVGGILNLVGLSIITSLQIGSGDGPSARMRLAARAAVRGFNTAACWSPFFVGMAAALTAVSAQWTDVVGPGIILAALLLGFAWLWEWRSLPPMEATNSGPPQPVRFRRIALILAAIAVPVITLHEAGGLTIPVAIAIVCPFVAGGLAMQTGFGSVRTLIADVAHRLPLLSSELFVLFAANMLALGLITLAGPMPQWLESVPFEAHAVVWAPGLLIIVGTILAGVGVHPLVLITFVAESMPDGLPGSSTAATALALAVSWGLGTMVSPISAVNMMLARITGVSAIRIAWLWNGAFGLAAAILAAITLTLFLTLLSGFP